MHSNAQVMAYLAPGAKTLVHYRYENAPPVPAGHTRVVCISDTHNEHEKMKLPAGHVLVHTGDVLTESGIRYVERNKTTGVFERFRNREGVALFEKFAAWFGKQPFAHKVLIGGNHDWVMWALGSQRVKDVLDAAAQPPRSVAYLDHEHATVGKLKVFGSPYGHWGSHNDAFMYKEVLDLSKVEDGTHIVLTHMPPLLPRDDGRIREDANVADTLHRVKALLSVSGHCHWAHGAYFTRAGGVPCVVASTCDSKWRAYKDPTTRGDPRDVEYGGYDLHFPIIVADIAVPPPTPGTPWCVGTELPVDRTASSDTVSDIHEKVLLLFGPPTDPEFVRRVHPEFSKTFGIHYFDEADDAVAFLKNPENASLRIQACVAKLGSRGNLGYDVMKALREHPRGKETMLIVHSATARHKPDTMEALRREVGVNLFVDHDSEKEMMDALATLS
eukprot:PhF_6_TR9260/c0_g1_i2/m.14691